MSREDMLGTLSASCSTLRLVKFVCRLVVCGFGFGFVLMDNVVLQIYEGSCLYASAIANKLMEVLDRQYATIAPTSSCY